MNRYGKFQTVDELGRGGMGLVYRAVHPDGTQVALKVMHPPGAHTDVERAMLMLQREVRAVAALNHRGIVHIVDVGQQDVDGSLQTWFAMELADGGTFEHIEVVSFSELARLLVDVLDALAYAHARGIVHRDIKPSNILLAADETAGWRCVLTDFGIAHVSNTDHGGVEEVTRVTAGTPNYMAPEQFHGDWRNYGPWTDLYALGCLAFEMACGTPPFVAPTPLAVALAHLSDPVPSLVPRFVVPDGFAPWLRRMLAKDHHLRYRCAADALWGLISAIGTQSQFSPSATIAGRQIARDVLPTMTQDGQATRLVERASLANLLDVDRRNPLEAAQVERPPVPYYVVEPTETLDRRMFGVGLSLFGLRQTPFVGRIEQRELLWSALRRACQAPCEVISLQGDRGSGRTRMLQWLQMRAHETGAAQTITVRHFETGAGAHGLVPAFANVLGVALLRGEELLSAVRATLQGLGDRIGREIIGIDDRALEVAQLLVPEPIEGHPIVAFESPKQRYVLFTWLLDLLCRDRPVLLTIDDAQWGWDSLAFARHALDEIPDAQLLIVVAASQPIACPTTKANHQRIEAWSRTLQVELGSLSARDHEALVRALAPLDRAATNRIVSATTGHPGRVAHLIQDLISCGALVPGETGYRLADGAHLTHEINTYWTRVSAKLLERLGVSMSAQAQLTLEVVAALGGASPAQIQAVMTYLGYTDGLSEILRVAGDLGILRESESVWSFSDRDYDREVRQASENENRWPEIHRACAECVPTEGSQGMPAAERRFVHLDLGGFEWEAAAELGKAVDAHLEMSSYERAGALAQDLERRLAALGVALDDGRRLRALTARMDVLRFTGRLQDALETSSGMERRVATCADAHGRADALRSMANVAYLAGDYDRAIELFARAFELAQGNDLLLAKLYHGAGWFMSNTSQTEASSDNYVKSVEHARAAGSERDVAWALHGLAELKARAQDLSGQALALEGREIFARVGSRTGWALCVQLLAEFARQQGHLAEAETLYLRSAETLNRVGSIVEALVRGRLAVLYYSLGNTRRALEEAWAGHLAIGHGMSLPARLYADLVLMKLHPDEPVRQAHREVARSLIARTGFRHPDFDLFGDI